MCDQVNQVDPVHQVNKVDEVHQVHQVDPVHQVNEIDEVHQVKQLFRAGGRAGGQKYSQEKSFGLSFFRSCVLSFFSFFRFNSIQFRAN